MNSSPQTYNNSTSIEPIAKVRVAENVNSASISPYGRNIVLASKDGLYFIDLDNINTAPHHVSHKSPWEVADVQWSPFTCRSYWIVSTSNQKALVWNLDLLANQTSSYTIQRAPIQYVLHAHTRAITDINFSPLHPDLLATCGVDSFVHIWDLRQNSRASTCKLKPDNLFHVKATSSGPAASLAEWNAGASQVKWNCHDSNIIASTHDSYLCIWDVRKGSYPLIKFRAHSLKIYGLDWSRTSASHFVTCSLDHTIKSWQIKQSAVEKSINCTIGPAVIETNISDQQVEATRITHVPYPVWRARHAPFGTNILVVMPHRENFDLHLHDKECDTAVATFTGHADRAREFLWRPTDCHANTCSQSSNSGDREKFQLISWGLDQQLIVHSIKQNQLYDWVRE